MEENGKYYWLKLKRDFFKRHDIRVIESMPNGKEYVLFYLKLLVESITHNGELRFSETIPYNEEMLAAITNTDIDKVRTAMKILVELKMIEMLSDATIFMAEVQKMTGAETKWAEKKRLQRASKEGTMSLPCPHPVPSLSDKSIEYRDKSKSKSIESTGADAPRHTNRFNSPSVEDVKAYCDERRNRVDPERFVDFYASKGWMIGKNKMKDWKAAVRTWEKSESHTKEIDPWDGKAISD